MSSSAILQPENYIYISHLGEAGHWWWIPCHPEKITDSMESQFSSTTALGRSAPVWTYSSSGPRTVQIEIQLHRDMMNMVNLTNKKSNGNYSVAKTNSFVSPPAEYALPDPDDDRKAYDQAVDAAAIAAEQYGLDHVDSLIKALQAISVPKYAISDKMVEPPLVAVRLSNEVFIKGIVTGSIGIEYELPLIYMSEYKEARYAQVRISFTVTEVDPYDATTIFENGSFRGLVSTMKDYFGG